MTKGENTEQEAPNAVKWECFCDEAYFRNWAVREIGETRWGHCFHVPTKEEAEGLTELLNKAAVPCNAQPVITPEDFRPIREALQFYRAGRSKDSRADAALLRLREIESRLDGGE